jgi:hypothetical protein
MRRKACTNQLGDNYPKEVFMRVVGIIFTVIGILSIIVGFFFFLPFIWGIPLTLVGIVMVAVGGKEVRRKRRAKIEVKILKLEQKVKRGKALETKAQERIDKLRIKQAKYGE